jgi:hypothetical protein
MQEEIHRRTREAPQGSCCGDSGSMEYSY